MIKRTSVGCKQPISTLLRNVVLPIALSFAASAVAIPHAHADTTLPAGWTVDPTTGQVSPPFGWDTDLDPEDREELLDLFPNFPPTGPTPIPTGTWDDCYDPCTEFCITKTRNPKVAALCIGGCIGSGVLRGGKGRGSVMELPSVSLGHSEIVNHEELA